MHWSHGIITRQNAPSPCSPSTDSNPPHERTRIVTKLEVAEAPNTNLFRNSHVGCHLHLTIPRHRASERKPNTHNRRLIHLQVKLLLKNPDWTPAQTEADGFTGRPQCLQANCSMFGNLLHRRSEECSCTGTALHCDTQNWECKKDMERHCKSLSAHITDRMFV
jgi:hypothetical protein